MYSVCLMLLALVGGESVEYKRVLSAPGLDAATLEAESFGKKSALKPDESGLHLTLQPGEPETGWRTPQALRTGGDFTIRATLLVHKLPKPAQDDGVAVGIAIASQNLDQPDLTFVRVTERDEKSVYRLFSPTLNQGQADPQAQARMIQFGMNVPKPVRVVYPGSGSEVRFVLRRRGQIVEIEVQDGDATEPRYIGQVTLQPNDLAGVKLFASNRNGGDAVDVEFRDLTISAERFTGLGTTVRTVEGKAHYGDPTGLEDGNLVLGAPTVAAPNPAPGGGTSEPPESATMSTETVVAGRALPAVAMARLVPANGGAVAINQGAVVVMRAAPAVGQAVARRDAPAADPPAQPAAAPVSDTQPKSDEPAKPDDKPRIRLPLDRVESIVFDRALAMSGRYVGQPNVDQTSGRDAQAEEAEAKPSASADLTTTPPGTVAPVRIARVDAKPNGIRDLHVSLSGLMADEIKQVTATCDTGAGSTSWRLDTSDSKDWPIAIERAGTEGWADLFLEPPAGDAFEKTLNVAVTYANGQNANASIQVSAHTDPRLAFEPATAVDRPDVRVFLVQDEQLYGKFDSLDDQSLAITTPWGDSLKIPIARIVALYPGLADHKESPESFARRLKNRGTEDLLLARSKDGEVVAVSGVADGSDSGKLKFVFQGKPRTLPLKQVEGLVFAARPEPADSDELRARLTLPGGMSVSGKWLGIDATHWKLQTPWGDELKVPAAEILKARLLGGQVSHLTDLKPIQVEEQGYLGRHSSWRSDQNLAGGPLVMDERTYARGLAVHARTVLTYSLGQRYEWFETRVGFDDAARGKGRVDCRVLADDRELYANPDLKATEKPVSIAVPVKGVKRLQLVVDFGPDEDVGDQVIWADPRLFRTRPQGSEPAPGPQTRK